MLESEFQRKLIKKIEKRFPGCIVMKNDPNYIQGFPDLTVLYNDKWALLECKRSENETHRPNQDYYIRVANDMGSYGQFVCPENEQEVLDELQQAFRTGGQARVP